MAKNGLVIKEVMSSQTHVINDGSSCVIVNGIPLESEFLGLSDSKDGVQISLTPPAKHHILLNLLPRCRDEALSPSIGTSCQTKKIAWTPTFLDILQNWKAFGMICFIKGGPLTHGPPFFADAFNAHRVSNEGLAAIFCHTARILCFWFGLIFTV